MPAVLSKKDFASYVGKKPNAVSMWIKRGKLTGASLTADGRIVVEEALRQLGDSVDPGRGNPHAETPVLPPAVSQEPLVFVPPPPGSLADIRLRTETRRLEEIERNAAIARGELIYAEAAERRWAEKLEELITAMELFVLDLPGKVGLDREAVTLVRAEWRGFRERMADQAEAEDEHRAA
jgi:hypothetical protein